MVKIPVYALFLPVLVVWTSSSVAWTIREEVRYMSVDIEETKISRNEVLEVTDSGQVTNCGSVPFNITWSPKVISVSGQSGLHFTVDYVAPHDVKDFILNASISYHLDPTPFIYYPGVQIECSKISKYVSCPIKKGLVVKGTFPFHDMDVLQAYLGEFDFSFQAWNEKKEPLICAKWMMKIVQ